MIPATGRREFSKGGIGWLENYLAWESLAMINESGYRSCPQNQMKTRAKPEEEWTKCRRMLWKDGKHWLPE